MKDIAKELNLSLATVSYVLNHSEKEKISHDTRFKVLDTAKRLGYVPCQTVKSLSKSRSNLIGININLSKSSSSYIKQQALDLAEELQKQIHYAGFDALLYTVEDFDEIQVKYKHSLDASFIIDMDEKHLKKITNRYYVPLVFLDCDFEESLFYKILPDYSTMIEEAKKTLREPNPYLIMDQIINKRLKDQITEHFLPENVYINRGNAGLKDFLAQRIGKNGIVIGDLLGVQVERYVDNSNILVLSSNHATDLLLPDTRRITVSNRKKAETAIEILKKLISLDYDNTTNTRILLSPDAPPKI